MLKYSRRSGPLGSVAHCTVSSLRQEAKVRLDEPCVYKKANGSAVVFLVLHVDDIFMFGNDICLLTSVKLWLSKTFSMKDLGNASYILGIKIYRDKSRKLIGLSQSLYLAKVLGIFYMEQSKKGYSLVRSGIHMSKIMCPRT
ncbi:unnamed protein product [Prunus armeniaca]